jgi:hypothetical protein
VGGGNVGSSIDWMLTVAGLPATIYDGDPSTLVGRLAVLERDTADQLDEQLRLEPLDGRRPKGRDRPNFRTYRVLR